MLNVRCAGAGWSSLVARRAHNPKVVGSNPTPATTLCYHVRFYGVYGGGCPFFYDIMTISDQIEQVVKMPIESLGYELVGVEYLKNLPRTLIRIYIDCKHGVSTDDCARVSHQVSGVLTVESVVSGDYCLEISSPGFDRPLFKACDFERFAGSEVKLSMRLPIKGRRHFRGVLKGLSENNILVNVDGQLHELPLTKLAKARLVA